MKTIPKPNDLANGFTATYDAWNRLVKIVDGATTVAEYKYDGLNQRIQKVVGADTYDFYYNLKWQAVVEFKNSVANRMNLHRSEYIDSLAVSVTASDQHYYLHDANYNVTAAITPSAGVAERYSYSPYGKVTHRNANFTEKTTQASDIGNEFLFTGRRLDSETGFYQFRNRYYSAETGRFVTVDPIRYNGSKWNLYGAYFVPDGLDPLGLEDGRKMFVQLCILDCVGKGNIIPAPASPAPCSNPSRCSILGTSRPSKSKYSYYDCKRWCENAPDRPINPNRRIDSYNCAGLAFRDYDRWPKRKVIAKLKTCKAGQKNKPCTEKGYCLKCVYYNITRFTVTLRGKVIADRKLDDYHIVCALGDGDHACSKNGASPISGPGCR